MSRKQQASYPFRPPRERGTLRALALAVVMHALLAFLLYHGIHWQNSTPAGEEAELWTEVPETPPPTPVVPPAPVAPAPPPAPTEDADIALQQQKRKQEEAAREAQLAEQQRLLQQQQQEAEAKRQQQLAAQAAAAAAQKAAQLKQQQDLADKQRQQQLADQKKQQQQKLDAQQKQAQLDAQKKADAQKAAQAKAAAEAQAKKIDQERRARIAQMQGLAGGSNSGGNGLASSGNGSGAGGTATSPGYAEKVQRRVRPNIIWSGDTHGLETVVAVHCAPSGTLLSAEITRSSGNAQWDDAALRAVNRSDPMPLDTNGKAPEHFTITLRPAAG